MPIIPILIAVTLILGGAAVLAVGCAPHLWDGEWNRMHSELQNRNAGNRIPQAGTEQLMADGERKVGA